jgi:hypothetical protein
LPGSGEIEALGKSKVVVNEPGQQNSEVPDVTEEAIPSTRFNREIEIVLRAPIEDSGGLEHSFLP